MTLPAGAKDQTTGVAVKAYTRQSKDCSSWNTVAAGLMVATILAGCLLAFAGLARLGRLIEFIP